MSGDSRQFSRTRLSLQVSYRTPGAFLVSYSVNLSKGGIFIETTTPLPIGDRVSLNIEVPGGGEMAVEGVVTWTRAHADEGMPAGMGLRFDRLEEHYGAAIDSLVRDFAGLSVLIVAASPDKLALLGRYVRSVIGCEIIEATSPEVAEVAIETSPPDLVVCDMDRGVPMGMRTIKAAKAAVRASQSTTPPVIILAGDAKTRQAGIQAGADFALATPPSSQDLRGAVIGTLCRPSVK